MAINWLALYHQGNITELRLVEDAEEVSMIRLYHGVDSSCIEGLREIQLTYTSCSVLILLLHLELLLTLVESVRFCIDKLVESSVVLSLVILEDSTNILILLCHRVSDHIWVVYDHSIQCL